MQSTPRRTLHPTDHHHVLARKMPPQAAMLPNSVDLGLGTPMTIPRDVCVTTTLGTEAPNLVKSHIQHSPSHTPPPLTSTQRATLSHYGGRFGQSWACHVRCYHVQCACACTERPRGTDTPPRVNTTTCHGTHLISSSLENKPEVEMNSNSRRCRVNL